MKLIAIFCAAVLSLSAAALAQEQVQVKFSQKRNIYLQYESIDLTLTLTNATDSPITLSTSEDGKSWLGFLVFLRNNDSENGTMINRVKPVETDPVTLAAGETRQITVNILPYYSVRSTGSYSVQAIVSVPGLTPVMTGKLYFTVGKGETIWKKNIFSTGIKRTYSLVRFLNVHEASLYLRVEEPDQNLLYNTVKLGPIVSYAEPVIEFDSAGGVHIVQVVGTRTYRYTETDADGNITAPQVDRSAMPNSVPTLARGSDGGVLFVGGFTKQADTERATLSETQE